MWKYWRDKKGSIAALEEYYPEYLGDPQIASAVAQVKNGLALIDILMQKAHNEADDDDDRPVQAPATRPRLDARKIGRSAGVLEGSQRNQSPAQAAKRT